MVTKEADSTNSWSPTAAAPPPFPLGTIATQQKSNKTIPHENEDDSQRTAVRSSQQDAENCDISSNCAGVIPAPLNPSFEIHARRTSHNTRHISHVTRHTSHVTRHTSHVTRHASHVTRHTSHVTRHTSQITSHTSCIAHLILKQHSAPPLPSGVGVVANYAGGAGAFLVSTVKPKTSKPKPLNTLNPKPKTQNPTPRDSNSKSKPLILNSQP